MLFEFQFLNEAVIEVWRFMFHRCGFDCTVGKDNGSGFLQLGGLSERAWSVRVPWVK